MVGVEMVVQSSTDVRDGLPPLGASTADAADTARNQRLRLQGKPTICSQLEDQQSALL